MARNLLKKNENDKKKKCLFCWLILVADVRGWDFGQINYSTDAVSSGTNMSM